MQTQVVPKILGTNHILQQTKFVSKMRHQILATFLLQLHYSKISFIVLVPGLADKQRSNKV